MDKSSSKEIDKIYWNIHQECIKSDTIWKEHILFTWRWWVLVFFAVLSWGVWIKFRKKESTSRLLYVGVFVSMISSHFDLIGVAYGLWSYPINVILPIPPFIPWDFCFMPVATMIFVQLKPKIRPLIKSLIFSGAASFIVEPLADLGGFYNPIHWKYYYSFPIFAGIFLIANFLYTRENFSR